MCQIKFSFTLKNQWFHFTKCHHQTRVSFFLMKFQILLYLTGQSLILLHQLLILLVYTQHLTDPVGSCLCLRAQGMRIM